MIDNCKEPGLKGFFIALKAMANTLLAEEGAELSRELKQALLLSPVGGKSILKQRA